MFEATLEQGALLKKVIESIKDLVEDVNWDCNEAGIALQSMDKSHVALVCLLIRADGFDPYRCDRNLTLGINMTSMSRILKCAANEDKITLSAEDQGDAITFRFEGRNDRTSEYRLKLMNIDAEHLGLPEDEYECVLQMSSTEFQRICRDLMTVGDSVTIQCVKDEVLFSSNGEMGSGSVTLRQNVNVDKEEESTCISLTTPVSNSFSLKYLNYFTKATCLSGQVTLSMTTNYPMLVEYKIEDICYLRFFLAPKIDDEE